MADENESWEELETRALFARLEQKPVAPEPLVDIERGKVCFHRQVTLREDTRWVMCKECGGQIDPFSYLLGLARHEMNFCHRAKAAVNDHRNLLDSIAKLKREERNLKGRVQRAKKRAAA